MKQQQLSLEQSAKFNSVEQQIQIKGLTRGIQVKTLS